MYIRASDYIDSEDPGSIPGYSLSFQRGVEPGGEVVMFEWVAGGDVIMFLEGEWVESGWGGGGGGGVLVY